MTRTDSELQVVLGEAGVDRAGGGATGPLSAGIGQLYVDDPMVAWARLQDLHRAAIGVTDGLHFDAVRGMSPETAEVEYGHALTLALGQITTVGPEANEALLRSVSGFASDRGSLDGLESVVLSAAAHVPAGSSALDAGARAVKDAGLPEVLGGGAGHALVATAQGQVAAVHHDALRAALGTLGQAVGGDQGRDFGERVGGLVDTAVDVLAGDADGADLLDALVDAGKALLRAGALIVGAVVGELVGGPVGGVVGVLAAERGVRELLGKADEQGKDKPHRDHEHRGGDVRHGHAVPTRATAPEAPVPAGSGPVGKALPRCVSHCPVDDEGFADGRYDPAWLPTVLVDGPGLDDLVVAQSGTVLLQEQPRIDGEVTSEGFLRPAGVDWGVAELLEPDQVHVERSSADSPEAAVLPGELSALPPDEKHMSPEALAALKAGIGVTPVPDEPPITSRVPEAAEPAPGSQPRTPTAEGGVDEHDLHGILDAQSELHGPPG